jgi:hypothetical protein
MLQFHKLSIAQLERHIRKTALDENKVVLSAHARKRMAERSIDQVAVFKCLMSGRIHLPPESDLRTGHLVCRMQRDLVYRKLAVCVSLDNEAPEMLVVTVLDD